jgi:hypothetical protein
MGVDMTLVTATSIVVGENSISCTFNLYDLKAGKYDVIVTNPDGQSDILTSGFTINDKGPVVSGVTPSEGMIGQTIDLAISGSGFKDPVKIIFRKGSSALEGANVKYSSDSSVSLVLYIPDGTTTGLWDIEVKNIVDQQNGTALSKFNIKNATA